MLFDRYKCIFVRISKVASTSVLNAFLAEKNTDDSGSFDWMHHDIKFYKKNYPDVFDEYFKFAFVRNPWDRIYSQYRYLRYTLKLEFAECSFEEFLAKCEYALESGETLFGRNREIFMLHLTNQLDWISINGELSVDFIGRYENIHEDFLFAMKQIDADIVLPHDNKSKKDMHGYRSAYTVKMGELVEKWHKKDIEYFGYKF